MRSWLLIALLLLSAFIHRGMAQLGSDSHTVTVRVLQITGLQLSVGSVSMTITGAGIVAGQDSMTTVDQSSILSWGTNLGNVKTTVATNLSSPRFTMRVVAINNTAGSAASERTLSTVPGDFLLNMGRTSGTSGVLYTGIARPQQGFGADNHVITFTMVAQ